MKALRNYLKKPLMAIFVGLLLFLWDHLILWPNGIFLYTDPEVRVVSIPIFAFCAAILLLIGKYRSTDWAWLFAGAIFHFLLIAIFGEALTAFFGWTVDDFSVLYLLLAAGTKAPGQYIAIAVVVGTIGWLIGKKTRTEVSETPDA